jgi:hypothetical protein
MLGMHQEIVDIPYYMITSIKLDKGIFSSSIAFRATGLVNSSHLGLIDKMADDKEHEGENGRIDSIPKDKVEELLEVIRNGMNIPKEEVYNQQQQKQHRRQKQDQSECIQNPSSSSASQSISIADELAKLAKLKEQGVISESEFQQMKQDLIRKM